MYGSDLPATEDSLVQTTRIPFTPLVGEPDPFRSGSGRYIGRGRLVPLVGFASESEMAEAVLSRLEPWFYVHREVGGRHPAGASCRIDAVLTPRDVQLWKRQDIALGIEFKALASREAPGRSDVTSWVAQAIDYAYVDWHDFGRIPIFMCPSPFAQQIFPDESILYIESFANGLLGQYGVGFLALYEGTGLSMMVQGTHAVWSERYGVEHGRRWSLRPHVGHRK